MDKVHIPPKHSTGKYPLAVTLLLWSFCFILPVQAGILNSALSKAVYQKITPSLESELVRHNLILGSPIFIRIFKESSELEIWVKGKNKYELFKTYDICSFSGELGPKQREGDLQSPEGFYLVEGSQLNPFSRFHLSFNLGYPNQYDRIHGRTGSALMVHGSCVSAGCFAMTDPIVEEIYTLAEAALKNGQPFFKVHIFPFRMTADNMARHKNSQWINFWKNLKEGYDYFEKNNQPPDTSVRKKRYVFGCEFIETISSQKKKIPYQTHTSTHPNDSAT
ncbi:MAG: murein L,D-transpeptidase [Desulfobulbaceae bacterium]|nr:murein L,D-transpeptidase [Desulfobulbaceae bacterium]